MFTIAGISVYHFISTPKDMLYCPKCNTHYQDDTLSYCLQDGLPLRVVVANQGAIPDEAETVVTGRVQSDLPPQVAANDWAVTSNVRSKPEYKKSSTALVVLLTVFATLLVFSLVGGAIWFYVAGHKAATNGNVNSIADNTNRRTPPPPASPSPTPTKSVTPTPTPLDEEEIGDLKREALKSLMTWRAMSESRDIDSYMERYADKVDYYLKKGATKDFVRKDKQKAFDMYDKVGSDISNTDVKVSSTGEEATIEFDKEWEFEGATRSKGKVRQEVKMKRVDGEWLIFSERDLKLYYKE